MSDKIITSPQNEKYRKGWEIAYGKKKPKPMRGLILGGRSSIKVAKERKTE